VAGIIGPQFSEHPRKRQFDRIVGVKVDAVQEAHFSRVGSPVSGGAVRSAGDRFASQLRLARRRELAEHEAGAIAGHLRKALPNE